MEPKNFFNPSQSEATQPLEQFGFQSTNFFNFPLAPEKASTFAIEHDAIFFTLIGLALFFALLVAALITIFVSKFHEGNKNVDRSNPTNNHLKLELTWTLIPLVLAMVAFYLGADLFGRERRSPADAHDVYVIGKQWMWQMQHPNGVRENNELHVPIGKPIRLTMISQDVIHALYIPAFRAQYQVLPGRYTTMWFTPTKPGKYQLLCNMYCGSEHSEMTGWVYAMPPADFEQWLEKLKAGNVQPIRPSLEQQGFAIFKNQACAICHTAEDSVRGPSLYGLLGKTRTLVGGKKVVADETYIRDSILHPYNNVVEGYPPTMPAFSQLKEDQILALIAYIKALGQPDIKVNIAPE